MLTNKEDDLGGSESRKLIERIIRIIRREGIPKYMKHWSLPSEIPKHFKNDTAMLEWINRHVLKPYHKHSFILTNQLDTDETDIDWDIYGPPRRLPNIFWDRRNKIGRIEYFKFINQPGTNKEIASDSAKIVRLVRQNLKKWKLLGMRGLIIDLRKHKGGDFRPLVKSLRRDVIGDASLFSWTNVKVSKTMKKWVNSSMKFTKFKGDLKMKLPIAILIGRDTTSSGELCAAIFKGRSNTRSFGQKTYGNFSSNEDFELSKKYTLVLTVNLTQTADMEFGDEFLRPDKRTRKPVSEAKKWIISHT